jgi:ATP-dependent Clp protease, protease subunit
MNDRPENSLIPYPQIIETTHRGERSWDLFSRLLKDRIVLLGSEIDDDVANVLIAELLYLESEDPDKEIMLYINSPGGVMTAGLAIYDTMQYIRCPIATLCLGQASSIASLLLCAGMRGRRYAMPNARVLLHQPLGGAQGQATDIEIHAREILHLRHRLNEIYAFHTSQDVAKIKKDSERDYYLGADEAMAYGLIDEVVHRAARPRVAKP